MLSFFSSKPRVDEPATPLDSGVYILRNRTSGTVLELAESNDKPVWTRRNRVQASKQIEPTDLKQCWLISTLRHDDWVSFLNLKGGTYIDLDDGSSRNGTLCYGYALPAAFPLAKNEENKEWLPTKNAEGYWRGSGTYLEINDGSNAQGATVQGWKGNEAQPNQQWELIPAPPNIIPGSLFVPIQKWMSSIPDEKLISELSIPGTHQSGAIIRDGVHAHLQCQENNHRWPVQLFNGIRHFDLRTFCDKDQIMGVSGASDQEWSYLGFQTSVERFLAEHPTEVVFAFVTIDEKKVDRAKVYTKAYADKWWEVMFQAINKNPNMYARCHGGTYASQSLKSLRGKLVLIVKDYQIPGTTKPIFDWAWSTIPSTVTEPTDAASGEAWDQTGPSVKWQKSKTVIEAAVADKDGNSYYHVSLDTDSFPESSPRRRTAFELNCFLADYLKAKESTGPNRLGFVAMDFYHVPSNLVGDIIATNPLSQLPPPMKKFSDMDFPMDNQELIGNELYRICLLGAERSGKTSLLNRFLDDAFDDSRDIPTMQSKKIKRIVNGSNQTAHLEILDTGGDPKLYEEKHQSWIGWGDGFVITYDISSTTQYDAVNIYRKNIEKIKKGEDVPILVIGTFSDKDARRKITRQQALDMTKSTSCLFQEVSSKTGDNVFASMSNLINQMRLKKLKSAFFTIQPSKTKNTKKGADFVISEEEKEPIPPENDNEDTSDDSSINLSDSGGNKDLKRKSTRMKKTRLFSKKTESDENSTSFMAISSFPKFERESSEIIEAFFNSKERFDDDWTTQPNRNEEPKKLETCSMVSVACQEDGFRIDDGSSDHVITETEWNDPDDRFYFLQYFSGTDYITLLSTSEENAIIIVMESFNRDQIDDVKAIMWTKLRTERLRIPYSCCLSVSHAIKYLKLKYTELNGVRFQEVSRDTADEATLETLNTELLKYEERNIQVNYKIGMVYAKSSKQTENELFSNNETSEEYEKFLEFIGEKIQLFGWTGYRGGLDPERSHSVFTTHCKLNVMFHVNTLLPYMPADAQQLERKRHTGNDVVVVVFKDDDEPFDPRIFKSHFNHVFCIVRKSEKEEEYDVSFAYRSGVAPFGPQLPHTTKLTEDFRNALLTKLVNGEKGAMQAKSFLDRRVRTKAENLQMICTSIAQKTNEREMKKSNFMPRATRTESTETASTSPASLRLNKISRKKSTMPVQIDCRDYYLKMLSYIKKLSEYLNRMTAFDATEFIYLLSETVNFIVSEVSSVGDVNRNEVQSLTHQLVPTLCTVIAIQHNFSNDPSLESEVASSINDAKILFMKILSHIEQATKGQEDNTADLVKRRPLSPTEDRRALLKNKNVNKSVSLGFIPVNANNLRSSEEATIRYSINQCDTTVKNMVESLSSSAFNREDTMEYIKMLAMWVKDIVDNGNVLERNHLKALTRTTEEIVTLGLDLKKSEDPGKTKELLVALNRLQMQTKDISAELDTKLKGATQLSFRCQRSFYDDFSRKWSGPEPRGRNEGISIVRPEAYHPSSNSRAPDRTFFSVPQIRGGTGSSTAHPSLVWEIAPCESVNRSGVTDESSIYDLSNLLDTNSTSKASLCSFPTLEASGFHIFERKDLPETFLQGVFDITGQDNDFLYYRDDILEKSSTCECIEMLCGDSPSGPVSISLKKDKQEYNCLIRTIKGNQRRGIGLDQVKVAWWKKMFRLSVSTMDIVHALDDTLPINRLKKVDDPRLPQALLTFEEQQRIKGFKFGLLYAPEGQTKEEQMFANIDSSPAFDQFISFLGDKVALENWRGFKAGLDTKGGSTGTHAVFKRYNNNDIMFHVSTLLPFNPKDKQQLERKRHIGNDIVIILFLEGETVYKPTTISSRQVHVVILVKPVKISNKPGETFYRVSVVSREGVDEVSPKVPQDCLFKGDEAFLDWLYSKLLNAERACYAAPMLSNKLERTRNSMLKDIAMNFT
ncbi:RapGAP/RanGAP domain-containing protein [Planoprotostelium fungivorum]|uniref:RapGAP/RanGAP domain-containing protein n=1 Tax=Planoprotostelium fungivorum TaxID=1890364 RepID=A0A2P6NDX8_9EUKA|nr:RapGAP/RanGAP domain-containing protein [Planoprotostelium fungivorum]